MKYRTIRRATGKATGSDVKVTKFLGRTRCTNRMVPYEPSNIRRTLSMASTPSCAARSRFSRQSCSTRGCPSPAAEPYLATSVSTTCLRRASLLRRTEPTPIMLGLVSTMSHFKGLRKATIFRHSSFVTGFVLSPSLMENSKILENGPIPSIWGSGGQTTARGLSPVRGIISFGPHPLLRKIIFTHSARDS